MIETIDGSYKAVRETNDVSEEPDSVLPCSLRKSLAVVFDRCFKMFALSTFPVKTN